MRALANSCAFPLNLEVDTTDSLTAVAGHICVSYRGCLICWGGYCYDEREIHYRETNWLYIFPYMLCGAKNNVWLKIQCETDLQLRPNSGATANVHQDQLYIFGGCLFDDLHRRMINTSMLIAIDLRTGILRAKQNPPNGCIPTPRDKTTSWIADEKFFIFGGYGMSWHRLDHGHEYFFQPWSFLDDDMGSCWNNQLLYYDLKNECWQEVNQKGTKPSQRAAAASAFVPQLNQVFLFGGRHDQTRLNDLYMLDMASFIWTQIDAPTSNNSIQIPAGRSWCTMVHLNEQKKILCYGGLCSNGEPLGDLWELDISEFYEQKNELKINEVQQQKSIQLKRPHWRLISPMEHQLPNRLWHCSVLMHNEAILIYGGMNESPASDSPFVRTLLVKPLQPPSLRQLALNALTEQILERWMAEMGGAFRNSIKSPNCGQIPPPLSLQVDLQFFANATGFMSFLPRSLHPHIRILLSIQKHAKSLKPTGGTTPRANSPFHWQPTPSNFHLLNLDGIQREVEEGQNSLNTLGFSRSNHWNVPLSPKSQKRSLADELFKHICENAKSRGSPFLEALFHSFDPL